MIYVVHTKGSGWHSKAEVEEFETERKALNFLKGKAKYRIIAVFNGKRLEPQMGETKVVKKAIVGLEEFNLTKNRKGK